LERCYLKSKGRAPLGEPLFFLGEENPFFSIKRVFFPQTPFFPKRTTKGLVALWTLAGRLVVVAGVGSLRDWVICQEWL